MTWEQGAILLIIGATLAAFIIGRWRYDVVALASLMVSVLIGVVPADGAFIGFSDPAVITVAAVLVISGAVSKSGFVDLIGARLTAITADPRLHLAGICALGMVLSAFMNNVAALTLLLPFVLSTARRFGYAPGYVLMPLSFSCLLGGMITLIGTPPNLLISNFRLAETGARFSMFDFAPVGITLALTGLLYLIGTGWLTRRGADAGADPSDDAFDIADYATEARIRTDAGLIGRTVGAVEDARGISILGVVRNERRLFGRLREQTLAAGDILLLEAETRRLEALVKAGDLDLVKDGPAQGDGATMEAVVAPNSLALGSTPASLDLPRRFGVKLLAAARQGRRFEGRLAEATLSAGDVLLLEGDARAMRDAIKALGCLPLAPRRLTLSPVRIALPVILFAGAIALAASGLLSTPIAFTLCVVGMILMRIIGPAEALANIDWSVIILLGAMIPVGTALETTGAAELIAHRVLALSGDAGPFVLLATTLIATMAITPVLNNPTAVIIMAPIALGVARDLGAAPEAFLMAVAIGASADFLTPFGHHNNTIILGPGQYRFTDYLRLGFPLAAIVILVALTALPVVWPL